jgi:hypothetical protein
MRFISRIAALALAATVSVSAQNADVEEALSTANALSQTETNGIQTSCLLLTDYFVD